MKRKIALMMSSVLLCAAIFGGCATYDAVDTAFTAFNDGNIEKAQKVYADKIKKIVRKKIVLNNCWVTTLNRFCFSITMKK